MIRIVDTKAYHKRDHMTTIGRIPKKLKSFFSTVRDHFTQRAWEHFWALTMAIAITQKVTIDRLTKALRESTHRTDHGEFLWRSIWNSSIVMQQIALDMLLRLFRKNDRHLFFIIDDTRTLKRAKKIQAVGKLHHHATGKYGTGHNIIKVSLYYRGVTIPWGSWLYIKKEHACKLKVSFNKLTELAAEAIRNARLPAKFQITVLFNAFYLCLEVVNACKEQKWNYIGVGKSNRWFKVASGKRKVGKDGRNVLRNNGKWYNITSLRKSGKYRLAERVGSLNGLGMVKIVFSRRRGESKHIALVSDDLSASM